MTATRCPVCKTTVERRLPLIHPGSCTITFGDVTVTARRRPVELMQILIEAWPSAVPYERIVQKLWGPNRPAYPQTGVQVYLSELRRATRPLPLEILTVWGEGLMLKVKDTVNGEQAPAPMKST